MAEHRAFKVIQGGVAKAPLPGSSAVDSKARTNAQAIPHEFDKPMPKPVSLKARAVHLLAQREYSRQALQEKLLSEQASPEEVAQALAQLEARGLVDDTRVAETVVNRRASKWGSARLRQDLIAKGLSAEVVAETVAGLKETELARALAVWKKKFGVVASDAATRHRQARFLVTRGFSSDVVRRVVVGLEDDAEL
ncbi:MAG: recombination regulator RecX [Limnohabitans sp.]